MQKLVSTLRGIDTPKPRRSLVPDPLVVKRAVKRNRFLRTVRSSAVAASVTVLLAAGVTLGFVRSSSQEEALTDSLAGNAETQQSQLPSTGQAATETPASPPTSSDRSDEAHKREAKAGQVDVTVEAAGQSAYTEAAAAYLQRVLRAQEVRKANIVRYEPFANLANGQLAGELEVEVLLQSGAASSFAEGTNKWLIEFGQDASGVLVTFLEPEVQLLSENEVLRAWVDARKQLNGVRELALFTKDEQQRRQSEYEQRQFVMASASPWGEKIEVSATRTVGNGVVEVSARLYMRTATESVGHDQATFRLKQLPNQSWKLLDVVVQPGTELPTVEQM